MPALLVAALAVPISRDLDFGPSALGSAISLYFLGSAGGSLLLPRLSEGFGSLRVMRVASALCALLLTALSMLRTWTELALVLVFAGVVNSVMQLSTNQFLALRIASGRHGLAFGAKQASVPLSFLLGGFGASVVALTVGWRWTFVSAALLASVVSGLCPKSDTDLATYRAAKAPGRMVGAATPLVIMAVAAGLGVAAATALSAFLAYAVVDAGIDEATAGVLVSIGGFAAMLSRIAIGAAADRFLRHPLVVVAVMLVVGGVGYVLLAGAALLPSLALLVPGVLLAFGAGWGWNGLLNLAVVNAYERHPARATGFTQVGSQIGGFTGPFMFAQTVTFASYTVAWLVVSIMALIAGILMLLGQHFMSRRQFPN